MENSPNAIAPRPATLIAFLRCLVDLNVSRNTSPRITAKKRNFKCLMKSKLSFIGTNIIEMAVRPKNESIIQCFRMFLRVWTKVFLLMLSTRNTIAARTMRIS